MDKFLSNDRKVILKSAAAGVGIISVLSLVLLTESMILWGLAFFGVIAVYWNIPTWFSRARQLEKKEIKQFNAEGLVVTDKLSIPQYQYFNADGEEVMKLSDGKQMFALIFMCVISAFLIISGYDTPVKFFLVHYPSFKILIIGAAAVISLSTPYLMRHIYCFVLNLPMDISFVFNSTTYVQHFNSPIRNNDDAWARRNSASYSYLPSNANYYSTHHHR